MKSIGVTLQHTYLTKKCKKKHCANPAKLSNIFAIIKIVKKEDQILKLSCTTVLETFIISFLFSLSKII